VVRAGNVILEVLGSGVGGAITAAVTTVTAEDSEQQIERIKELDVSALAPIGIAVAGDALVHSVPILSTIIGVFTEPLGAAAGVAYLMTLVLSSQAVDPKTLAPEGTVLNAKKAEDTRAAVRVPFTEIIPLALKVIDFENTGSSGAGWSIGEDNVPRLPITSVAIVLGVGTVILELIAHGLPGINLILPRTLQVAAWLAAVGYLIDKRILPIGAKS
jgi:hypothetical protein